MNILSLHAENYRTYDHLAWDVPQGIAAILGPNGAGKSTLVETIELALYGRCRTGPMSAQLAPEAEQVRIECVFSHAGETFRVRRTLKAGGSPRVDLERWDEV